jgi:hypothetical protein
MIRAMEWSKAFRRHDVRRGMDPAPGGVAGPAPANGGHPRSMARLHPAIALLAARAIVDGAMENALR